MAAERTEVTDGRRARRERGRAATIAAVMDLVSQGNTPPTVEQIAEHAGVSAASVFRYFDTLEDLFQETTTRYFDRYASYFEVTSIGDGPLERRVEHLVSDRVRLYETVTPFATLARSRALHNTVAASTLRRVRATLTDQISHHFDTELAELTAARRDDLVATIASLTSFESWEQFTNDHQRSGSQIRRAWRSALLDLLDRTHRR